MSDLKHAPILPDDIGSTPVSRISVAEFLQVLHQKPQVARLLEFLPEKKKRELVEDEVPPEIKLDGLLDRLNTEKKKKELWTEEVDPPFDLEPIAERLRLEKKKMETVADELPPEIPADILEKLVTEKKKTELVVDELPPDVTLPQLEQHLNTEITRLGFYQTAYEMLLSQVAQVMESQTGQ